MVWSAAEGAGLGPRASLSCLRFCNSAFDKCVGTLSSVKFMLPLGHYTCAGSKCMANRVWGCAALQLRAKLPALVQAVKSAGQVVTWVCDPMHANTEAVGRYKTRRYDNIRAEVRTPSPEQHPLICTARRGC